MLTFKEYAELLEFSQGQHVEHDCSFKEETHREVMRQTYEPNETVNVKTVAADLLVKQYIPLPTQLVFYAGYAAGDPELYIQLYELPIE